MKTPNNLRKHPDKLTGGTREADIRRSRSQEGGRSRLRVHGSGRIRPSPTTPYTSGRHQNAGSTPPKGSAPHQTPLDAPATPARTWYSRQPRKRILFYHKHNPHYGFTNFSPHAVDYKGRRYPTGEHLFQSLKFQDHRPNLADHIRTCSESPSVAFSEARRFQPEVRPDWRAVNVARMDETLRLKFTQHRTLRQELLSTGDAELVEDSAKDAFWGIGADGKGRNELGKALERLRAELRKMRSQ